MKQGIYKVLKSKTWDTCWLILGIVLVIASTYYSYSGTFDLLLVTSFIGGILGMVIVLLFANQYGKTASGLGVVGAIFDTFNNFKYGLLGNVFVGIYCAALYAKGFLTMGKEIEVTKVTKSNLYISAIIALVGSVVLYFYGGTILPADAPLWVIVFNVLVFLVQVISQYLMVEGKAISWIGWILANFINLALQIYVIVQGNSPTAMIYLSMTIMFQLNSIKAAILWYGYGEE
ncbi:nicotinamide mononucleotide transporter [Paenibacillus guangzhouensis]|uniref:nicotinamide mononucleotide transporter n=1 Tax=Paenibacillus guangzhouensis TaxID=1473112 RepID=UPI001266E41D|nr:nicotinamide mononucleotide transporter [Paenibacillus guangzhouensis]